MFKKLVSERTELTAQTNLRMISTMRIQKMEDDITNTPHNISNKSTTRIHYYSQIQEVVSELAHLQESE